MQMRIMVVQQFARGTEFKKNRMQSAEVHIFNINKNGKIYDMQKLL